MTRLERARAILHPFFNGDGKIQVNEFWTKDGTRTIEIPALEEAIAEALPNDISDKEIEKSAYDNCDDIACEEIAYAKGATWAREKILGKE